MQTMHAPHISYIYYACLYITHVCILRMFVYYVCLYITYVSYISDEEMK